MITFISCSNNNRAATVLAGFKTAVERYGCPSRLRTDRGGENVSIVDYMIMNRGAGRNSAILGSSTHNQRIERVWRDVTKEVTSLYKNLFSYIEDQLHINFAESDMLFVLHALFMSSINNDLESFRLAWNNHPMRTSHGRSPNQLFRLHSDKSAAVNVDPDEYGIEYTDDEEDEDSQVVVESVTSSLSEVQVSNFLEDLIPVTDAASIGFEGAVQVFSQAYRLFRFHKSR